AQEAARAAAEQQAQEAARAAAEQQAQEAVRAAAEQQAQEAARAAAEQQAPEPAGVPVKQVVPGNTYIYGVAAGLPALAQAGARQMLLPAASSAALQGAIRAAVGAMVAGTGTVLSVLGSPVVVVGVVVGVVVVTAAVLVAKHERSLSISTLLSDVMPIESLDLQRVSAAGGVIELPYTLVTDWVGDRARVSIVKPDGHVVPSTAKVWAAQFDAANNAFSVKMDSPSRIFMFTPIAPPGGDIPSFTSTPGEHPVESPNYEGVTLDPVVVDIERLPLHQLEGTQNIILVFPKDSGLPPLLVVFSKPYGDTDTVGTYSGRAYHSDKTGGAIAKLSWQDASVDAEGIGLVKLHTGRFGKSADNEVMIRRLEDILAGRLETSDIDKKYYTHEIRELERYRVLGVPDGVKPAAASGIWNSAHAATLEDFRLRDDTTQFYTAEAIDALNLQMNKEFNYE
ncbi:S-type pyocin domain-containing protein, partial [Pseudomonas sp. RIT-To-2]|uniref:S-type pyocin domain-containing protein n=1 Tax=Pseudomonas sp. RIT-To-2 TaxID=3462541 RepID=UPI0024136644